MKGPTQIGLQDLLRASHIKRWHIVCTAQQQTLAEHNYGVATIALSLYNDLTPTVCAEDISTLALAALYHDAPEVRTGDIPTPGKRLIRHFGGADIFDKIDRYIKPETPFIGGQPSVNPLINDTVKMADYIEAAVWIRENGVGNRAKEVAEKCWRDMEDYANHLQAETELEWRAAVNRVLAALLAPTLLSSLS
jgi:hypothetical protein